MNEASSGEITVDITERTVAFSLRAIRLYRNLPKDDIGRVIGKQLLRSSTSIGANVHEAQGAQSKADFIAKMSIAHKEAVETEYWLRLLAEADVLARERLSDLRDEANQINRILAAILLSAKRGKQR